MGIVVPETFWAYKNYYKIISDIWLDFILQLSQWCTAKQTSNSKGALPLTICHLESQVFIKSEHNLGKNFDFCEYIADVSATMIEKHLHDQ